MFIIGEGFSIGAYEEAEIIKRIRALSVDLLVFIFYPVNVSAEQPIFPVVTLQDFIAYPSSLPRIGTN
jgi:hypothetical protein